MNIVFDVNSASEAGTLYHIKEIGYCQDKKKVVEWINHLDDFFVTSGLMCLLVMELLEMESSHLIKT